MARIQLKRGLNANLPTSGMLAGEPMITTDRGTLYVATDTTTKTPVVPALEALDTIPGISGAEDLLIVHDASETSGQKEKKITFNAFKTALSIPAGSTDEKVAASSSATGRYLYGTGSDGALKMGSSMTASVVDGGNQVQIDVSVVDGGSF